MLPEIDTWNRENRIGTQVRYWKNTEKNGPGFLTKTRSQALLLHNMPVIYVQGVPQPLPLTQIAVTKELRRIVDPKRTAPLS